MDPSPHAISGTRPCVETSTAVGTFPRSFAKPNDEMTCAGGSAQSWAVAVCAGESPISSNIAQRKAVAESVLLFSQASARLPVLRGGEAHLIDEQGHERKHDADGGARD